MLFDPEEQEEEREDIFAEGWRNPAHDLDRLSIYILVAVGALAGLVVALFGSLMLFSLVTGADIAAVRWFPNFRDWRFALVFVAAGTILACSSATFLWQESRRWSFKGIRADQIVAGGMAFALMLVLSGSFLLAPLAAVFFLTFLLIGLVIAGLPYLAIGRTWRGAVVEARYGLDQKLCEHPDHPSPAEDGMRPYVRLRTPKGVMTLPCSAAVYDMAEPGSVGTAQVRSKRLTRFRPERRRAQFSR